MTLELQGVEPGDHLELTTWPEDVTVWAYNGEDPPTLVVLDRASVEKLHAWLGAWLERDDG